MYLIKLALRPWRVAPYSQMFSSIALGFLLLLVGLLFWMQRSMSPVLARLQGEQVVTAYLDPTLEAKDEDRVVDQIRTSVGAHPMEPGPEVKIVHPEQFVEHLSAQYPDLSRELQDLGPEVKTIIPRYVSVAGILPDGAFDQVKSVPGVESAETSKDRYRQVVGAFRAVRWVSGLLMLGLALAILTGLIHLTRMNAYLHQDAVSLLRLWGAGHWTLQVPAIISGALVGIIGGGMAAAGWSFAGVWMAEHVRALSPLLSSMPQPSLQLGFALLGVGMLVGVFSGVSTAHRPGRS